jgi:ATP-dependent exoDNAse (exonuclease V) beta subunit
MRPVPIDPTHLLITASAGSGKTWRLSRRLAGLILAGEPPETLVALTFTRKAAGEFFDAVLGLLATAAQDGEAARRLARELGGGPERPEDVLPHLKRLVRQLHRLQFTTIDSFFHRIVAAFPFELGLSGDFTLMDGFAAERARMEVLEELLRRDAPGVEARRQFLESFKLATFGKEEKFAASEVVDFVDKLYPLYLEAPGAEVWAGVACPVEVGEERPGAAAALVDAVGAALPADRQDLWEEVSGYLRDWEPGAAAPSSMAETVRNNILKAAAGDGGVLTLNRKKIPVDGALGGHLRALAALWAERAVRACLLRTRGTARILEAYHAAYDARVRRSGRLVFDDLPRIIGAAEAGGSGLARLEVDYRLDARFRHWLLDEFQDTSRAQWAVLENLIDEAVQDPEGRRTFFCVGDRKQSIYGWRGGDHRLFLELKAKYGERLGTESLRKTFRCSGAVVELVNRVMGQKQLEERLGAGGAAWLETWEPHESARPGTGFAAYLEAEEGETEGVPERHRLVASLIEEADPVGRGWSCAVLVASNDEARRVADVLRASLKLPVVLEGEVRPALDNTLGLGLLAWARALAHPSDTLAEGWIMASGGGDWLRTQEDWRAHAWEAIHTQGIAQAGREWMAALVEPAAGGAAADVFLEWRRRELLRALRMYEDQGGRDPGELEDFLRHYALNAPAAPGSVQVMTIHKAKGLGFDLVVLTQLVRQNHGFNRRRDGPLVARDARGRVRWICEAPPKALVPFYPELEAPAQAARAENAFEQLCLLYVALTRAKEALYVVGEAKVSDGEVVYAQHVVREGLEGAPGGRLRCGAEARAVFGTEAPPSPAQSQAPETRWIPPVLDFEPVVPIEGWSRRMGRDAAGRAGGAPVQASAAFREAQAAGRAVHEVLARVERATPSALERLEHAAGGGDAAQEALACARAAVLKEIFLPGPEVVVWREQPFYCVLEDGVAAGVFDRVLLWPDEGGGWRRADVVDFKTDRIEPRELPLLAEKHRDQLMGYRAALARLLDLDPAAVRCRVVSTALRQAVEVK